jgi:outer membrane protein insertion porin family
VNASAISDVRRRLYETGVYRSVEIDLEPVEVPTAAAGLPHPGDRGVAARIRVQERPRYSFRYGLALNDDVSGSDQRERRVGFAADLENRNMFGLGATVGLSARLRRDQQVGRVFASATHFFGLPLRSNLFLSRGRQTIATGDTFTTVADTTEISAEQTYRLRRLIDLRYGYEIGRNRTTFEGSDFDLTVRVARFTTGGTVDRRNDPFDPARGWFTSANLELSRPGLGSQLSFLSSFLQYFQFIPLREGLVVASAARVGMARTFGDQVLIPSERFFAGGATSVRGYREGDLGPRSIFGDADGGEALLIFNEELRFQIYRWLRGVGFIDLGNVYETLGDVRISELQVGAGAGLRLNTPMGLLRLDLSVPTSPRALDPKWRVHFGLGHAF